MTNDEVKKKIADILNATEISTELLKSDIDKLADALIEAGIGDMKEVKFEADHYWSMWQGTFVKLERAKHRAEVAERALKECSKCLSVFTKSFGDGATEEEVYNKMIKIAEKELSEEMK